LGRASGTVRRASAVDATGSPVGPSGFRLALQDFEHFVSQLVLDEQDG